MAFKQVFYALRDVFPQIDLRILKAVASQYSSDVDAAVEFVLSDVLPAVSEPTEAHYTLQDIDYATDDHSDSWSKTTSHERTVPPAYCGSRYNNLEDCSLIKDKVVINETITTQTIRYDQVEASSASASKSPIMEYEQSASTTFVNQCAMEKGKRTSLAENVANQKHFNSDYNLPNFIASSGSILPLYTKSPSDFAVKYNGQSPLKLPRAGSTQDSESQDMYNLENLFATFNQLEDKHASVNSLGALTVQTLCASEDNYDLQALLQKEMSLKLCEAETVSHLSKPEDNFNLDSLFSEFSSNEDRETSHSLPNVPTFQTLPESEDNYDMQVLFEKGKSLEVSATQRMLDISNSEDNYKFQDLFKNIDNVGKGLYMLHSAESTPGLRKSEDDLYKKSCASNSNTQVPIFLRKDENNRSSYKIDDECTLPDLFVSLKHVNSSQIFDEKDSSCADGSEEQPSIFPEPLSSSTKVSLSNLEMKCEVRNGAEKKVMCSNSVDKQHSIVPFIVHDAFQHNEIKLMPGPDNYDKFPESYQIAGINKLLSDITNSKEQLSSLYDSTSIKTKEVELQEGSSRKAKQDVVKVRQDSVAMVENFNQLIKNAKESNNKQAQIVREEKSLLEALAQDLHSQLTKLSVERDEAFTIVGEVKLELDARLATSIEEEAVAREQISQEEKLVLLVRKEKEVELGSIMEESRKLQNEDEENILLRNFLSDCGRAIDMLQGEISSVHEKLIALKERTQESRLQSALIATEKAVTSSLVPDCKIALPDRHPPIKNRNNNDLKQKKMVESQAKDHEEFSDEEWEMLETIQVQN